MDTTADKIDRLFKQLLNLILWLAIGYVLFQIAGYFYSIVVLLGLALVITYILLGPVNLVERGIRSLSQRLRSHPAIHQFVHQTPEVQPRILAVITVYFAFFMTLTIAAIQLLPALSHQIGEFGHALPSYITQGELSAIEWSDKTLGADAVKKIFEADIARAQQEGVVKSPSPAHAPISAEEKHVIQESVFKSTLSQATHILETAASTAVGNFIDLVTRTLNGLIYFLTGLVLVFYFLLDGPKLKDKLLTRIPAHAHETSLYFLNSVHQVMFSFIKGQVLLGGLTGLYMFVIYSLFGVKYAIFLSVFQGIAEILPVIGTWIGLTPGIIVMLFSDNPWVTLWVWLCSYGYQSIKDNVLTPKIVGEVMGLHPIVVILSLLVGAQIAGLLGVLLALPTVSLANVIIRYYLHPEVVSSEGRAADIQASAMTVQ